MNKAFLYGLAKAAGDTTQESSANAVGTNRYKMCFIATSKHPVLAIPNKKGGIYYITDRDTFFVKRVNQYGYYLHGFSGTGHIKFYVSEKNIRKLFNLKHIKKPVYRWVFRN